jgi:hypothetical protein
MRTRTTGTKRSQPAKLAKTFLKDCYVTCIPQINFSLLKIGLFVPWNFS